MLTDRLLALMLDGTDPARILCLTFTRAAAAEMANRINERLADWATLRPGALAEDLAELTGRMPSDATIARARQLFARVLDMPGRHQDRDDPRLLPIAVAPLPAGSGRAAGIRRDGRAQRRAKRWSRPPSAVIIAARERKRAASWPRRWRWSPRYAPEERFVELMAALAAERGKLRHALGNGEASCAAGSARP